MRIFLSKWFQRFARKESIDIGSLCVAVEQAEVWLVDADLGSGVIKQRIPRPNEGKSGGFRSIVIYRSATLAFIVYGFAKNERDNITAEELKAFKQLARTMLTYDADQLDRAVAAGAFVEVECDE